MDQCRHAVFEEGNEHIGWRGTAILRSARQARQLSGRDVAVGCQSSTQASGGRFHRATSWAGNSERWRKRTCCDICPMPSASIAVDQIEAATQGSGLASAWYDGRVVDGLQRQTCALAPARSGQLCTCRSASMRRRLRGPSRSGAAASEKMAAGGHRSSFVAMTSMISVLGQKTRSACATRAGARSRGGRVRPSGSHRAQRACAFASLMVITNLANRSRK